MRCKKLLFRLHAAHLVYPSSDSFFRTHMFLHMSTSATKGERDETQGVSIVHTSTQTIQGASSAVQGRQGRSRIGHCTRNLTPKGKWSKTEKHHKCNKNNALPLRNGRQKVGKAVGIHTIEGNAPLQQNHHGKQLVALNAMCDCSDTPAVAFQGRGGGGNRHCKNGLVLSSTRMYGLWAQATQPYHICL